MRQIEISMSTPRVIALIALGATWMVVTWVRALRACSLREDEDDGDELLEGGGAPIGLGGDDGSGSVQ